MRRVRAEGTDEVASICRARPQRFGFLSPCRCFATPANAESGLAKRSRSVRVGTGESILDVLLREGFDIDCSCREGVCGTCEQRILQGVPDHRDAVLTAEERRQGTHMMICVSRSSTPSITLDL